MKFRKLGALAGAAMLVFAACSTTAGRFAPSGRQRWRTAAPRASATPQGHRQGRHRAAAAGQREARPRTRSSTASSLR